MYWSITKTHGEIFKPVNDVKSGKDMAQSSLSPARSPDCMQQTENITLPFTYNNISHQTSLLISYLTRAGFEVASGSLGLILSIFLDPSGQISTDFTDDTFVFGFPSAMNH